MQEYITEFAGYDKKKKIRTENLRMAITFKISEDSCKGCGLCIPACPKKLLNFSEKLNKLGYKPIANSDVGICTACGACAKMCPDMVFYIEKS